MLVRRLKLGGFLVSIYVLLVAVGVATAVVFFRRNTEPAIKQTASGPVIELDPMFYEEENFARALALASSIKSSSDIAAVVVPHHLLSSTYVAQMFKMASGRDISTVIIVGPNHQDIGPTAISTTQALWRTPENYVATNDALVRRLNSDFSLRDNPSVFTAEHSIGAIVPFVSYFFPKATIVPIALSSTASRQDAEELGEWLNKQTDEHTLVVFSIDFSHYLTQEVAAQRDQVTRQLIESRDHSTISRLNNDYIDSPASLVTALDLANLRGLIIEIIDNKNSNDFSQIKSGSTTSYFVIAFREGKRLNRD